MKRSIKLLTLSVILAMFLVVMATTATASSTGAGTTDGSNLIQYDNGYEDRPVKYHINARQPTADFAFEVTSDYNVEIFYYPKEKGTKIVELRHESVYYWDKIGLAEFWWSDNNGKTWNYFAREPIYWYLYKTKVSLWSGNKNICYKIRVGIPPIPDSADFLTVHVKIHR